MGTVQIKRRRERELDAFKEAGPPQGGGLLCRSK